MESILVTIRSIKGERQDIIIRLKADEDNYQIKPILKANNFENFTVINWRYLDKLQIIESK